VKKTSLKDGDMLVLRYPGTIPLKYVDSLRRSFESAVENLRPEVKCIVLEEGLDVEIYRKEQ